MFKSTRNLSVIVLVLVSAVTTRAQGPAPKPIDPKVLAEINEQVWIPFCKSFETNDSEMFVSLHTTDMVRVSIDRNDVKSGEVFRNQSTERMQRSKEAGRAGVLTLRFTQRTHGDDAAFETGVYRYASKSSDHVGYGEFNVLLQKVDGRWKIALDADKRSTEKAFEAARPMDDVDW